jgi:hypothetical protein
VEILLSLDALRGIDLTVVTYPYHARLLSAFQETGLCFEDWHRGLAAFSARSGVPLRDFSRVSTETVEPIPAPGDTRRTWGAQHRLAGAATERLTAGEDRNCEQLP